jgi:hypothetical protein
MRTLAQTAYLDSTHGEIVELPHAGSALEHPLVFDSTARELKQMAAQGKVEIVDERCTRAGDESLIDRLLFRRLR